MIIKIHFEIKNIKVYSIIIYLFEMSEETNNFSKWLNVFNLKLTTGEENMNFLVKNS